MAKSAVLSPEPSTSAPIDADIARALRAFASEVSYAVQMAKAAAVIERKRSVWNARRQAKQP